MLSTRLLLAAALLTAVAVVVFWIWPDLDLTVAGWLYQGDNRFLLSHGKVWVFYDEVIRPAFRVGLVGLALWALWLLWRRADRRPVMLRRIAFVVLAILLGPVLVVDTGFKSNSGRARPSDVMEFAGERTYSPPLVFSDQCERNCSFVSGDAAAAFATLALALLAVRRRALWISLSVAFGLAIGGLRIAVGGHFLSDVIFAGLIVAVVTALCYRFVLEGRAPPAKEGVGDQLRA